MADIFNPDFQIHGDYNVCSLARAECAARRDTDFNPETCCPYDRTLCRQKLVRIIEFEEWLDLLVKRRSSVTFRTTGDMFYACPVPQLNCIRRHRYEEMLKKFKQKEL